MPSVYQLKPAFQRLLRPGVARLASAGVTANAVTVAAAVLSIGLGAAIAIWPNEAWPLLALPAFLLLRMALNAVDGMLARDHGQRSRLGAILNELGDVVSDAALYLPLAFVTGLDPRLVVMVVVLAVIAEMTGVLGIQVGASRRYDGPMGKSDRALVFGALGLWLGLGGPGGMWLNVLLALVALALVVTIANRARKALREMEAGA
ncbi:CDP-alcohol phosphatidyltransferase family protein [Glycomyces buryatensis]|uniref:CDP-alcohol phosphatidyltransferase family protein n=1 Tax=Glycomyces buryatensis TaxID=2570927 RepID=A0A4S8QB81_9ACTN|nr:CDP-alcohol phosphatidyltransferase family protein [Glycomyces buryatensis]THV40781.1 CDP-alcohol phosphatidyltransferase family protein [Glycomyces buryatensis]